MYEAVGTPSYIGSPSLYFAFSSLSSFIQNFVSKAPEILVTLDTDPVVGYRTEVDVWGVGVICYILYFSLFSFSSLVIGI